MRWLELEGLAEHRLPLLALLAGQHLEDLLARLLTLGLHFLSPLFHVLRIAAGAKATRTPWAARTTLAPSATLAATEAATGSTSAALAATEATTGSTLAALAATEATAGSTLAALAAAEAATGSALAATLTAATTEAAATTLTAATAEATRSSGATLSTRATESLRPIGFDDFADLLKLLDREPDLDGDLGVGHRLRPLLLERQLMVALELALVEDVLDLLLEVFSLLRAHALAHTGTLAKAARTTLTLSRPKASLTGATLSGATLESTWGRR